MAGDDPPLLANTSQPVSETEDDRIAEEDALLTGQRTDKGGGQGSRSTLFVTKRWQEIGLVVWAAAATAVVIVLAVVYQHNQAESGGRSGQESIPTGKRNLIFMVSDGMGPTSLGLTRSWRQYSENLPYDETLVLDEHLIGQSRTRSSSSLVTDSAAGATAFSCGLKSYNGAISVLPDHSPCGSVMEAAKRMGYTTGLVVTTSITDATPAVFVSHVRRREMEDEIAQQMIGASHPLGRMVDLMFGGGRCHFLPNSTGPASCRSDNVDVIQTAKDQGWDSIETKEDFDGLGTNANLPLMGLFARTDFPYEIDRVYENETYPSLEEMTRKALAVLSAATKDTEQGFFIMIEGSRIDHAGHANDPGAQVREVLAYDQAMGAVLDFIEDTETPTLMVATSDHETGGLATARQLHAAYPRYQWFPGVLANASHSASYTGHKYHEHLRSMSKRASDSDSRSIKDEQAFLAAMVADHLGIVDPNKDELDLLIENKDVAAYLFADMISRRAQTGWSTHGHSGADVNIYASDPIAANALVGNHENTDVGAFLQYYLGLEDEVDKVTRKLIDHLHTTGSNGEDWLGGVPASTERLDGQDHLDHYHGDHKRAIEGL